MHACSWDWVVYGNTTVKDLDRMVAYEKALNTWAKWIDSNLDTSKIQVFFQGVSPDHPRYSIYILSLSHSIYKECELYGFL